MPFLSGQAEIDIVSRGQRWRQSWHPPGVAPDGKRHGSAGICVTDSGDVVVISSDEILWDFPAGRPEGDEDWEQTLRREMLEEACATVTEAHLLGFSRGHCVEGHEAGLVLVRSIWLARVTLGEWKPQFEIAHRKFVPFDQAISTVLAEFEPVWTRAFQEARRFLAGKE
jgi:8-oxo-dGTP pyrophosphatase MutT (NUDIX family)